MKLTKVLFLFCALALTGSSCSSSNDEEEKETPGGTTEGELALSLSTNAIKSDGKDYCEFIVKAGETTVTEGVTIYQVENNSTPLSSMRFSSTQEGTYTFFASYGDKVSSQVSVMVLSTIPDMPIDPQPENTSFVRRVLALQFTGTGCPNCPYMIGAIKEIQKTADASKVLFAGIHSYNYDDIMYTKTVAAIGQAYGNGYYPGVGCNMRKNVQNAVSSINVTMTKLQSMINEEYAATAKAGISASAIKSGNQIIVKADIKAAQAGQYRIGAWILEDGIYARQSNNGVTGDYDFDTHNNVVREISGQNGDYDFTGNNLGDIAAGKTKSYVMSFKINSEWNLQNCKIVLFVSTPDVSGSAKKFYVNNAILCNIDQVAKFEYK